jgi:hypothetical protein
MQGEKALRAEAAHGRMNQSALPTSSSVTDAGGSTRTTLEKKRGLSAVDI